VRNLRMDKWDNDPQLDGLLLFAQAVVDMLFDYTLDSYKLPTLNTHGRCRELLEVIVGVKAKTIKSEKSEDPVLHELKQSLEHDVAAKSILGARHEVVVDVLQKSYDDKRGFEENVAYLAGLLDNRAYLNSLQGLLPKAVSMPTKYADILPLTQNLITELLTQGYSRPYVCRF